MMTIRRAISLRREGLSWGTVARLFTDGWQDTQQVRIGNTPEERCAVVAAVEYAGGVLVLRSQERGWFPLEVQGLDWLHEYGEMYERQGYDHLTLEVRGCDLAKVERGMAMMNIFAMA